MKKIDIGLFLKLCYDSGFSPEQAVTIYGIMKLALSDITLKDYNNIIK